LIAVDLLGSGPRVSASFQKIARLASRLGSWMSASNQIFALTAGGNVVDGEGNCAGGVNVLREYVRGECPPVVTEVMQLVT